MLYSFCFIVKIVGENSNISGNENSKLREKLRIIVVRREKIHRTRKVNTCFTPFIPHI